MIIVLTQGQAHNGVKIAVAVKILLEEEERESIHECHVFAEFLIQLVDDGPGLLHHRQVGFRGSTQMYSKHLQR